MFSDVIYDSGQPIYQQIMTRIRQKLASGEWEAGERVPAVRDLATAYGVNPNTMQRALAELEREELLYSERTSGRYITQDTVRLEALRRQMADEILTDFRQRMRQIGYNEEDMRRLWQKQADANEE